MKTATLNVSGNNISLNVYTWDADVNKIVHSHYFTAYSTAPASHRQRRLERAISLLRACVKQAQQKEINND